MQICTIRLDNLQETSTRTVAHRSVALQLAASFRPLYLKVKLNEKQRVHTVKEIKRAEMG